MKNLKDIVNNLIESYNNKRNQHLIQLLDKRLEWFRELDRQELELFTKTTKINDPIYHTIEEKVVITNKGYEEYTIKKRHVTFEHEIEQWDVTKKLIPKEKYIEILKKYDEDNVFKVR